MQSISKLDAMFVVFLTTEIIVSLTNLVMLEFSISIGSFGQAIFDNYNLEFIAELS